MSGIRGDEERRHVDDKTGYPRPQQAAASIGFVAICPFSGVRRTDSRFLSLVVRLLREPLSTYARGPSVHGGMPFRFQPSLWRTSALAKSTSSHLLDVSSHSFVEWQEGLRSSDLSRARHQVPMDGPSPRRCLGIVAFLDSSLGACQTGKTCIEHRCSSVIFILLIPVFDLFGCALISSAPTTHQQPSTHPPSSSAPSQDSAPS